MITEEARGSERRFVGQSTDKFSFRTDADPGTETVGLTCGGVLTTTGTMATTGGILPTSGAVFAVTTFSVPVAGFRPAAGKADLSAVMPVTRCSLGQHDACLTVLAGMDEHEDRRRLRDDPRRRNPRTAKPAVEDDRQERLARWRKH